MAIPNTNKKGVAPSMGYASAILAARGAQQTVQTPRPSQGVPAPMSAPTAGVPARSASTTQAMSVAGRPPMPAPTPARSTSTAQSLGRTPMPASPSGGAIPATTNYGGKGNPLNEILYRKKQYDAGNKGWASSSAGAFYNQLDPTEAATVKGMNTQQLIDYIGTKNQPAQAAQPAQPETPYMQLTPEQIAQEAQYEIDSQRADLANAVNTQSTSLRDNAAYANQLIADQRVLDNAQMDRTLNPFSGRTSYDKAMVMRGRGIDDSARGAELTNQLNAISTDLYNFDKLAPERQRQIYNELLNMERQFGLQQGQLTGNYGGQRTLQGQQFDRSIFESDRGYNYQVGRDARGDYVDDRNFGRGVLESDRNFDRGILESDRNFDRAKYESDREYQFKTQQTAIQNGQWQQQFDMDVQKFGFQQASEMWSQAFQENQASQDDAYRKAALDQEMTQSDRSAANNAADSIMKSGLVSVATDPNTGQQSMSVPNKESLKNYIMSLNLSDNATDSLLYQFNLGEYVKK